MIISVVPDLVSFIDNSADEAGVALGVRPDEKKRSLHVGSFQNIENLRRPPRIGAVIKSDCHLMFAPRALVIKRGKLRELRVPRRKVTLRIGRQISHPIRAGFIHRDNFTIPHIGDRVRPSEHFQQLARLIVDLEIARKIQCVPNRRVFRAEPVKREAAGLLIAHFAQLV